VHILGTFYIVDEVINQSPVTAKFVTIIVTFYDGNNQVVGTDSTYTKPSDLAPGQRAPFDILVLSGGKPNTSNTIATTNTTKLSKFCISKHTMQ
jgi:hypothetical protein